MLGSEKHNTPNMKTVFLVPPTAPLSVYSPAPIQGNCFFILCHQKMERFSGQPQVTHVEVAFKSFDDLGYKIPHPFMTPAHLAKVNDFLHSVSENEFVIVAYPKSGTNLMMQVVVQFLGNGTADFDNVHS